MNLYQEYYGDIVELISPIGAQTESSIALYWNKPKNYKEVDYYHIYKDGILINKTSVTNITITSLEPGTIYQFQVLAMKDSKILDTSNETMVRTKEESRYYDITQYGAVAELGVVNTTAIQAAIDDCCNGGTVYVPSGTFVTGALFLKSNMSLYLEEGALLLGSDELEDYPVFTYRFEGLEEPCYSSLINTLSMENGKRLSNITIHGKGKIDASGVKLRPKQTTELKGKPGRAVCIRNTDNVYLYGITVKQSPAWCVHMIYCSNVTVNQVSIHTKRDEDGTRYHNICNGDGLTIDSTTNTYVFASMIASQDDCISIKSGKNEEGRTVGIPTEDLRISDCRFLSGFGIAFGSEMSGGLRNILLEDCSFDNTYSVASLKSPRGRGGVIEDIICRDVVHCNHDNEFTDCKWFRGALLIDEFYSHDDFELDKLEEINDGTSIIRNIIFEHMTLETTTGNAIYLAGLPEQHIEHITLRDIKAVGKYGMKAYNVDNLKLEQVHVVSKEDTDYLMKGVTLC